MPKLFAANDRGRQLIVRNLIISETRIYFRE
jgi:hypothetical protein